MKTQYGLIALASLVLAMTACQSPTTAKAPQPSITTTEPESAKEATLEPKVRPSSSLSQWQADGIVTQGEYPRNADLNGIHLWWRVDGVYLYLAIEGETEGWIGIGINPERGMQGADYLFGYVEDGEAKLWDAYGTAPTGPNHPPDEDLGGSNDIAGYAGKEEGGITRFEIQIPLDSGDAYDQVLELGQSYPILVAIGKADNYNAHHLSYARGELALPASPDD